MRFLDHVIVLFWACVHFRTSSVFTTRGQPFGLTKCTNEYSAYRIACLDHNSYVGHNKNVCIGLPGYAFLKQSPIWVENVHDYNDKLYPQQQDARRSNLQRSIFVPLLEGNRCYGVLELAMSSFMTSFSNEMSEVCRALKEEGFRSWDANEIIKLNTWKDHSPIIELRNTTKECDASNSSNITCNDITMLFGLPKVDAAKRFNKCENTFGKVLKMHGIAEWPCKKSGIQVTFAHNALAYGREFKITYGVAGKIKEINSMVMQDNDDINCKKDSLLDNYMKELESLVCNGIGEQLDETGSQDLLVVYHHKHKSLN